MQIIQINIVTSNEPIFPHGDCAAGATWTVKKDEPITRQITVLNTNGAPLFTLNAQVDLTPTTLQRFGMLLQRLATDAASANLTAINASTKNEINARTNPPAAGQGFSPDR